MARSVAAVALASALRHNLQLTAVDTINTITNAAAIATAVRNRRSDLRSRYQPLSRLASIGSPRR